MLTACGLKCKKLFFLEQAFLKRFNLFGKNISLLRPAGKSLLNYLSYNLKAFQDYSFISDFPLQLACSLRYDNIFPGGVVRSCMCLILFSWNSHPKYKLIVAANRDEFYARPTAPAAFWEDYPGILAGKDLQAGGSWMGIEKDGYFAAVTNYRDLSAIKEDAISRGDLIKNFLIGKKSPEHYLNEVAAERQHYNGFNLIVSDLEQLFYYSNVEHKIRKLDNGNYGLSNALLNTPWPKVQQGKAAFEKAIHSKEINVDELFEVLRNADQAKEEELPATGIPTELEKALSSVFIKTPDYGTYSSTVLLLEKNGYCKFEERTYADQKEMTARQFGFQIERHIKNKAS